MKSDEDPRTRRDATMLPPSMRAELSEWFDRRHPPTVGRRRLLADRRWMRARANAPAVRVRIAAVVVSAAALGLGAWSAVRGTRASMDASSQIDHSSLLESAAKQPRRVNLAHGTQLLLGPGAMARLRSPGAGRPQSVRIERGGVEFAATEWAAMGSAIEAGTFTVRTVEPGRALAVWDRAGATLSISVRAGRFVVEPSCAGPARSLAAGDWQRLACPLRGIAGGPGSSPLRSPAAAGDIAAREDALETSGPADDPSLVAYWPFDEVEGSTIAADWTGHDHAAKLHRQGVESRFAEGLMGGALLLDRGYAEVAAGPGDDLGIGADGLTVAAWLYRVRDGLTFEMVASRQSGTSDGEHFALGFYQNQLALLIETQPPEITVKDWGLVPNDRWVHVAGTYDGSTASLYVDGREVARAPVARQIAPDMTPVLIGGNANGPRRLVTENFPGRIDDLRIYRRALRPAEVERLARFPSR